MLAALHASNVQPKTRQQRTTRKGRGPHSPRPQRDVRARLRRVGVTALLVVFFLKVLKRELSLSPCPHDSHKKQKQTARRTRHARLLVGFDYGTPHARSGAMNCRVHEVAARRECANSASPLHSAELRLGEEGLAQNTKPSTSQKQNGLRRPPTG